MFDLNYYKESIKFLALLSTVGLSKALVTQLFYSRIADAFDINLKSSLHETRYGLTLYRFLFTAAAVFVGIYCLKDEDWVFDVKGFSSPIKEIPYKFTFYYAFEICFYIVELLTIGFEPKKKDFFQIALHHVITLVLMFNSYRTKIIKFGVVILLMHDISDPFLEFCKLANYYNNKLVANFVFVLFMCIFVVLRLFVYPRYILYSVFKTLYPQEIICFSEKVIMLFLFLLQIMHIIWSYFIVRMFIRICTYGKTRDYRERYKSE